MRGGTFDVPPRMFCGKILGKSIAYMTVAIFELNGFVFFTQSGHSIS